MQIKLNVDQRINIRASIAGKGEVVISPEFVNIASCKDSELIRISHIVNGYKNTRAMYVNALTEQTK